MVKVLVLTLVSLVLSGCATIRLTDAPPAHQAEAASSPSPTTLPARVLMTALPGWDRTDGTDVVSFRHAATGAEMQARIIEDSPDTPTSLAGMIARRVTEDRDGTCVADAANGTTYAMLRCERSRDGRPPERSILAIRRPSGRSDVLLLLVGRWPASLPTTFDEEVDLMFLMATAE
jgi:hypothetical protein